MWETKHRDLDCQTHITKSTNSTNKGEKQSKKRESQNLKRLSDTVIHAALRLVSVASQSCSVQAAWTQQPKYGMLQNAAVPWPHRAWQCPLPHPLMNSLLQLTSVQWDLSVNGNIFQCRTMKWSSPQLCVQIWAVLQQNKENKIPTQEKPRQAAAVLGAPCSRIWIRQNNQSIYRPSVFLSKAQQRLHTALPLTEYAVFRCCFMPIWVKVFHLSVMEKMIVWLIYKKQTSHRLKWQFFGMRIITVSA